MSDHGKKMIAPIVVSIIVSIYYIVYFCVLIAVVPGILKLLAGVIPLACTAVMWYVCMERINEINGGEEDDIGKY